MAYKDIEQWAMILKESEDADKAYEKACNDAMKEAEEAANAEELNYEDEVIDPASVGFLDSEDGVDIEESEYSDYDELTPSDLKKYSEMVDWFNANGYPLEDDEERLEKFMPQGNQLLFKAGCSPSGKDEVVSFSDALYHYNWLKETEVGDDDKVDLAECGFTDDGQEIAQKEIEDDLNEDLHHADEYASIDLEVDGKADADGDDTSFEDAVRREVPGVSVRKAGMANADTLKYHVEGTFSDLQQVFAFYLGLRNWDEVVKNGDDAWFNEIVVFQDGDTLDEADYRDAIAHVFDPIGVKASTANLKATNTCEMSIVKEAVKAELQKRKMKKALLENDFGSLSDEDLEKLDSVLAAKDEVDANTADNKDERLWLAFLKTMGINSIEEYKAMDPAEFDKRFEASNKPLDAANGFARSYKTYKEYHKPDEEAGGATSTEYAFNPDYNRRLTRAEAERIKKREEKSARKQDTEDLLAAEEKNLSFADMSPAEFGQFLHSLDPRMVKQLQKAMLDAAAEVNKDDPETGAQDMIRIKRMFGKSPTFRDIARLWYPGEDPNKRQQSVNKFFQDTEGMFLSATRRATGTTDGSLANFRKNVLGNKANFQKFLQIIKDMSKQRSNRKNSIINRGKKNSGDAKDDAAQDKEA